MQADAELACSILTGRTMQHAEAQPESTSLCPHTLHHLGNAHEAGA